MRQFLIFVIVVLAAICSLSTSMAVAQDEQPPTSVPTTQAATQPASQPTSRPTTSQAVQEQKREAEIKEELAGQTAREAESKLDEIRVGRASCPATVQGGEHRRLAGE